MPDPLNVSVSSVGAAVSARAAEESTRELARLGVLDLEERLPGWIVVRLRDPATGALGPVVVAGPAGDVFARVAREMQL